MNEGPLDTQELVKRFARDVQDHLNFIVEPMERKEQERLSEAIRSGGEYVQDKTAGEVIRKLSELSGLLDKVQQNGVPNTRSSPACLLCTEPGRVANGS